MSVTKHQIFKIKLSNDGKFNLDKAVEKKINDFLAQPNNVYLNHSITILSEDIVEYGDSKTVNKYVLVSLIYKDLRATPLDIEGVSGDVQETVKKEIETGSKMDEPILETNFDKDFKEANTMDLPDGLS